MVEIARGLEGIYVAESGLGFIDGKKGILRYCGYPIEQLVANSTYEETCWLLWNNKLPKKNELKRFDQQLKKQRQLPKLILEIIPKVVKQRKDITPMDALRTGVSALGVLFDSDISPQTLRKNAIDITAKLPTIIATFHRLRTGKKPIAPNPKLSHATNFLYMLTGKKPTPEAAKIFDAILVMHAEHGFNASTFSARVTCSTLSDLHSAITSAIGTLKGPLHGGANMAALKQIKEIKKPERAEKYVMSKLAKRERIMGFGHRVYKVKDPRAKILEKYAGQLAKKSKEPELFAIQQKIQEVMEREKGKKGIYANVDFFSSTTYYYLGIPADLYPTIFALSRVAGWTAHCFEQYADNRLIRPREAYVGPTKLKYIPIEQR